MTEDILAFKNIELGAEFSRYVLEHPKFAAKIPENALVVYCLNMIRNCAKPIWK